MTLERLQLLNQLRELLRMLWWVRFEELGPPTPRLELWQTRSRRQEREGIRLYDDLWRAACWEAAAREAWNDGSAQLAYECCVRAAEIIPGMR